MFDAGRDGLQTGCMVLFIITGATVFGHFMVITNIPFTLADWVGAMTIPPTMAIGVIIVIYFIGGFFMDSMALIVVTLPIFFPVIERLNFDPIWFGVIIVLVAEMGVITPPVGINVYVVYGVARGLPGGGMPLESIFKGIAPFMVAVLVGTIILAIFPQIILVLPNLMY